ncbi:MAG: HAD hydrolase family protein, partial [Myxococcota bacterium]
MSTLYVSDLDGTLLDREGQLSPTTRASLRALLERGLCFTIATARSVVSVRERFDLPLALPLVTANGTFVDDLQKPGHLHIAELDRAIALTIWEEARSRGIDPLVTTTSPMHGERMFFPSNPGGPTEAWASAADAGKMSLGSWSITSWGESTVWIVLLFGLF